MAHADHLKVIKEAIEKKDIEIWNKWRQENPDIRPDLRGADLSEANLQQADLQGVILKDANLSGADLNKANLMGAKLRGADLSRADISGTNLSGTNLSGADLCEANLSRADLNLAQLSYVRGLVPSQIKSAVNWEAAFYSQEILVSLGLPPDHNEKLREQFKKEQERVPAD